MSAQHVLIVGRYNDGRRTLRIEEVAGREMRPLQIAGHEAGQDYIFAINASRRVLCCLADAGKLVFDWPELLAGAEVPVEGFEAFLTRFESWRAAIQ